MLPGEKTLIAMRKFDAKGLKDTATKVSAKYKNRRRLLHAKWLKKLMIKGVMFQVDMV